MTPCNDSSATIVSLLPLFTTINDNSGDGLYIDMAALVSFQEINSQAKLELSL